MAGHSKWKQIKEKKSLLDKKRSQLFSKLLIAITAAAQKEANPEFNPRLKAAIERAKRSNVPQENIERAIRKVGEVHNLEEITLEAYGPAGVAFIIEAITNNKNRTIQEIKTILKEHEGRLAEPGATVWAFERLANTWQPKFKQELSGEDKEKVNKLVLILEEHPDVQNVYTNLSSS